MKRALQLAITSLGILAIGTLLVFQPALHRPSTQVARAATSCKLGIVVFYDISGSMAFTLSDGTPKYVAAENSILGMYDKIASYNNGSKILYTEAFHANGDGNPPVFYNFPSVPIDTTNPSDRATYKQYLDLINPASADYTSKVAGGTPTASALKRIADTSGFANIDSDTIPVAVIVTDGYPEHNLANQYTGIGSTIVIKDSSGNFLDPSQVQAANPGVNVSSVVDMMNQSLRYKSFDMIVGSTAKPITYGLAVGAGAKSWNPDLVDYFASMNNPDKLNRTFTPDTNQQFGDALTNIASSACAGAAQTKPTLSIQLPPKSLYTPNQLNLTDSAGNNYTFNFNSTTGQFGNPSQGSLTVDVSEQYKGTIYDGYVINISGIKKGNLIAYTTAQKSGQLLTSLNTVVGRAHAQTPPPATTNWFFLKNNTINYKMTFVNPPVSAAAAIVNDLISTKDVSKGEFLNGLASCADPNQTAGGYLCLTSKLTFSAPEFADPSNPVTVSLLDSMNVVPSLIVNGNVAGSTSVQNFTIGGQAIAVGGTVTAQGAAQVLNDYFTSYKNSKIAWGSVSSTLSALYNQRTNGVTYNGSGTFGGSTWYLNSSGDQPQLNNPSSFSAPPEGKLWNVDHDLTISEPVTFNGRGTIVVNGNVTFAGSGGVSCANGQVGIIASGSITFQGAGPYSCGAYVALGQSGTGSITFPNINAVGMAPWNVILVARNDITLPKVLNGNLVVNYNSDFANNPTVLFKELLDIVFSSPS